MRNYANYTIMEDSIGKQVIKKSWWWCDELGDWD